MKHGQILHLPNSYNSVQVDRVHTANDYEKMTFKQSLLFEEHFEYWLSQFDDRLLAIAKLGDSFFLCLETSFKNKLEYESMTRCEHALTRINN